MQSSQDFPSNQPLAIIGIGCRFPGGVESAVDYWNLIYNAKDAIVDVPRDRWNWRKFYDPDPEMPGKMYVKSGGFLKQNIEQFDALFFGITPREASCMDPQQRILLEVVWEAIEDGGLNPYELAGANVGVYVGALMLDHNLNQMSVSNRNIICSHSTVGSTMTILSNRVSYVFDFRGPSLSIDTACSSSLVALHYACQDLWRGACSMAVAGGVNIMFTPEHTIAICKGHFLSPDGRCKSFDERANGYGRGEGAGVVVLKPLSAAIADRDRIYALVRATGCNQDGRTSGITVPSAAAQGALLRRVCVQAAVAPERITYIEAHGTGTPVGDPTEAFALGTVAGAGRLNGDACPIGSVKPNIGHLEAAAGIAGVIKAALCISQRTVPPLAGLQTANPAIPFTDLGLRLPIAPEPMPSGEAYVAVNSFGYGGTNACALLAAPQGNGAASQPTDKGIHQEELPYFLPLSARSESALRQLAENYVNLLSAENAPAMSDVCYSAGARRGHHKLRLALWSKSREGMLEELCKFAQKKPSAGYLSRTTLVEGERPVFVFSGMGPQWWGMGQELYRISSIFRESACECDRIFRALSGWSILDEMLRSEEQSRMQETEIAQPASFVIQAALVALLRSIGIEPSAIVGHSLGEVSTAYVGGALNMEDAIRVSLHRSRLLKRAAGLGSMLAVGISAEDATQLLAETQGRNSGSPLVSIAAANSPSSVTLSGNTEALKAIAEVLETKGIFHRFLQVEVPYHSPFMEPLREELFESLRGLRAQCPSVPLYSTMTGDRVDVPGSIPMDEEYWWQNLRQPVQFVTAMRKLIADGHKLFLEVGPHPVLSTSIKECIAESGTDCVTITTLRRNEPEGENIAKAIGALYTCGAQIGWGKLYSQPASFVPLPLYPWQRETHWHETPESRQNRVGEPAHPLLGDRLAEPQPSWRAALHRSLVPYLDDHRVEGLRVLPGAAYVELGLAIHAALNDSPACVLENLQFQQALIVEAGDEPVLRCAYDEKTREYTVHSRSRDSEGQWLLHAKGRLSAAQAGKPKAIDIVGLQQTFTETQSSETHYYDMERRGLQYGEYFRGIRELFLDRTRNEILARMQSSASLAADAEAYQLHPGILDSCFQTLLALVATEDTYVPVRIAQVRFFSRTPSAFWCHGKHQSSANGNIEGYLTLFDDQGEVFAEIRGVVASKLTDKKSNALQRAPEWLYSFDWVTQAFSGQPSPAAHWLVLADEQGVADALLPALAGQNVNSITTVRRGSGFVKQGDHSYRLSPENESDFDQLLERIGAERCERILYFWGLHAPSVDGDITGSAELAAALRLLQALARVRMPKPFHFFMVTKGAHPVIPAAETSLPQAPLTGLLRVAMNEYSEHRFTSLDLDPGAVGLDAASLVQELLSSDPEDEIAFRSAQRYVHRLLRQPRALGDLEGSTKTERVASSSPFKVEVDRSRGVRLRESERSSPGPNEIEIRVEAFKLCPSHIGVVNGAGEHSSGPMFDLAGTIIGVGSEVEDFKSGDLVVASLLNTAANYATLSPKAACVAHRPLHIAVEKSLGLMPFVSALHALESVDWQSGKKILIHATSATGFAALQLVLGMGGKVFAAVRSEEDGHAARALGAHHVVSASRADFPEQLSSLTEGVGVDVVFGIERGDMLTKSFEALAPGGCYIHLQENEDWETLSIPPNANRSFAVFDPRAVSPECFRTLWSQVCLQADTLQADCLPAYPISAISEALRHASESGSRSNFTVTVSDGMEIERLALPCTTGLFKADASYLVTGGFSGLGLEVAKWAVRQGVRHMVLVSRRGAASAEAKQAVEAMTQAGAKIWPVSADISDRKQVHHLLMQVAEQAPPLRGVFHAAAVFDDAPMADLNRQRLDAVMLPKACGALHLHEGTRNLSLDFFVLFSSIASQVGNPRQLPYSAANAYLDAFAHWRRGQGLPATSVNWGAVGSVGILSRQDTIEKYLLRVGNTPFTPQQCLEMLGKVLRANPVQVSIVDVDWQKWAEFHPAWAASARFKHLIAAHRADSSLASDELLKSLLLIDESSQLGLVSERLQQLVAQIMRLPASAVDTGCSLVSMGIDSLMAMEVQVAIEREIGLKVSALELMKGITIAQLSRSLLTRLMKQPTERTPQENASAAALAKDIDLSSTESLERLNELSTEKLDSMLLQLSIDSELRCSD